jgi:peroxiredoxin
MKQFLIITFVAFSALSLTAAAPTPGKSASLRVGDVAPDFTIAEAGKDDPGAPSLKLSDFKGKKNVLVAFYPKAFTPGCTAEMCGFRDDISRFQDAETEVVAVSVDEQAESDRFKKEKGLQFHVVGDPEKKIIDAYKVPLMDIPEKGSLAKRSVFLIDKKGVVRYIDPAYDVRAGKNPLYRAIEDLRKGGYRSKSIPGRVCPTC